MGIRLQIFWQWTRVQEPNWMYIVKRWIWDILFYFVTCIIMGAIHLRVRYLTFYETLEQKKKNDKIDSLIRINLRNKELILFWDDQLRSAVLYIWSRPVVFYHFKSMSPYNLQVYLFNSSYFSIKYHMIDNLHYFIS